MPGETQASLVCLDALGVTLKPLAVVEDPGYLPATVSLLGPSTSGWLFLRFTHPSTPLVP